MSESAEDAVVAAWASVAQPYHRFWAPRFAPFVREAVAALEATLASAGGDGAAPLGVVGSGPGDEVLALARNHPRRQVVAIEPAGAMRELLAGRVAAAGLRNVVIDPGAATALPAALRGAAGILSTFVLQLLPDRLAALAAWRRALAPGGRIVVLFWPRQRDEDAWGRLGRAMEATSGRPRPEWEAELVQGLASAGLRLLERRDVQHEIVYANPEEAWDRLVDACSLQVFARRVGPVETAACRRRWLAEHGLIQDGERWSHRPCARLWVLALSRGARPRRPCPPRSP